MPWFCNHPDCKGGKNGKPKRATFAKPGEKPVRCKYHMLEGMESTNHKICAHDDCTKQPYYGHNGEYTYCNEHKLEGMEYSAKQKTCAHDGCTKQPFYGHNGAYTYCDKHRLEGMEYSGTRKTCAHDGCTTQPVDLFKTNQSRAIFRPKFLPNSS